MYKLTLEQLFVIFRLGFLKGCWSEDFDITEEELLDYFTEELKDSDKFNPKTVELWQLLLSQKVKP